MSMIPRAHEDLDPVGQLLRDLDRVATDLQFTNPIRLYGDKTIIDGAILALTIVRNRISELQPHSEAAE